MTRSDLLSEIMKEVELIHLAKAEREEARSLKSAEALRQLQADLVEVHGALVAHPEERYREPRDWVEDFRRASPWPHY